MSVNSAPFLGVAPEHMPALIAALAVVALLPWFMVVARRLCGRGFMPAVRFIRGYYGAPLADRIAAALMVVTGVVHLAVAAAHGGDLRGWFLLDGLAFLLLAAAVFMVRWWRPLTAGLLVATLLAYVGAIGSGEEAVDHLGIATKAMELTALGLVLLPSSLSVRRPWLSWGAMTGAVLALGVVTGAGAWGAMLRTHDAEATEVHVHADGQSHAHGHSHGDAVERAPTPAEAEAAARLAAETTADVARYADVNAAIADGYRVAAGEDKPLAHYQNRQYMKDDVVLDPTQPEQLVYANTTDGPVLVGVVYVMPRPGMEGPAIGGPITRWHTHTFCAAPMPSWFAGLLSPFGTCPAGTVNAVMPEMMHVWTVDHPGGPFAEKLDPAYLKDLTGR